MIKISIQSVNLVGAVMVKLDYLPPPTVKSTVITRAQSLKIYFLSNQMRTKARVET